MEPTHLYQSIAESIRQSILSGEISPGDRLASVREMAGRWGCTIGTVQRAYGLLAEQGLVVSRPGQGTHVVDRLPVDHETPLRRAALIHRAESFLLEVLTAGYTPQEVERAVRQALDRWRVVEQEEAHPTSNLLRFVGSHDLALAWVAGQFDEIVPGAALQLRFAGSLGGLIALAQGQADLAGSHLWDAASDSYNAPFVSRLLPGRRVALVTLSHRRMGLIVPPGNPEGIRGLADLPRSTLPFVNRQPGSGTRVWLDTTLHQQGIETQTIPGYTNEKSTHTEVARAVAEGEAGAGFGLQAAAQSYELDFVPLQRERYDLVIPQEYFEREIIQVLMDWLARPATRAAIENLGGYETEETGHLRWVG